jgi:hypothetical protein
MSNMQDEDIKRWTAKRKSALVLDIIQGKATVAEASRQFDLPPAEIEDWVSQAKAVWWDGCLTDEVAQRAGVRECPA